MQVSKMVMLQKRGRSKSCFEFIKRSMQDIRGNDTSRCDAYYRSLKCCIMCSHFNYTNKREDSEDKLRVDNNIQKALDIFT